MSYNACGVLSHIMFDGPEAWGVCEPQREEVEERMWAAIQSWDINSRRNINYRCHGGRARLVPGAASVLCGLRSRSPGHTAESAGDWNSPSTCAARVQPVLMGT